MKPLFEIDTRDLIRGFAKLLWSKSVLAPIPLVSEPHHIVEAFLASRCLSDLGVE